VLQFSKPMDTNSVQNSFITIPRVKGTFTWSAASDTMTFTLSGDEFPELNMVTVRVTQTAADAVSGNTLYSPYEMRFKTAAPIMQR
jgi:hypothetical protein